MSGGSPADLDLRYDRLLANLGRGIELYHRYEVTPWEQWLRKARAEIVAGDAHGLAYMLSAYGGMVSINDLYICPWNGHPVAEGRWERVTDLHDEITEAIYEDVTALIRYYEEDT